VSTQTGATLYGSDAPRDTQRRRFTRGEVPVTVYGLGKMGLPIASVLADVTGNVTGVDIDEGRVAAINRGECPVSGEPGLPALVAETVAVDDLRATTDGGAAATAASVHVVIVPTTVRTNGLPDLSALREVVRTIGSGLGSGDLVLVESTVPPRTCSDVVRPLLEHESGLELGQFGLAFCPERTKSGRALRDICEAYPKVVGGADGESARAARLVYEQVTDNDVLVVADATTAECVKVFEGVYRDVNIALANELARFTDDLAIDVREAIDVANTLPVCDIHDPGVGVGGHCIPYYPYFLLSTFGRDAPLIRTARAVNDGMPRFAVRKLRRGLERRGISLTDARILVLGVTYRPGVAETRESPAWPITQSLTDAGATVFATDPVLDDLSAFPVRETPLSAIPTLDLDGVILVTAHEEFGSIDWDDLDDLVVVDGRDVLDGASMGHEVYTIGRHPSTAEWRRDG
jgi:UDP-N-acetyl-D-mannosaminuronic acid dehydrogenase